MFAGWFAGLCNALGLGACMSKRAIERQLIGGILEMMNDNRLFHKSTFGRNHEYSDWTDEGREALLAFVTDYSRRLMTAQDAELNERAKALTWQALREEESK